MAIFMDLRQNRDYQTNPTGLAKNVLEQTVDSAIRTAMSTGKRNATVDLGTSKGAASDNDVRATLMELNQCGYKAQFVKGNILDINW